MIHCHSYYSFTGWITGASFLIPEATERKEKVIGSEKKMLQVPSFTTWWISKTKPMRQDQLHTYWFDWRMGDKERWKNALYKKNGEILELTSGFYRTFNQYLHTKDQVKRYLIWPFERKFDKASKQRTCFKITSFCYCVFVLKVVFWHWQTEAFICPDVRNKCKQRC